MAMPNLDPGSEKKPLGYDPVREKFIYYDEIVSGKEKIIPVETLTEGDFKILMIERLRSGPDFRMQSMNGPLYNREQIIAAIAGDVPEMRQFIEAERSYLRELLQKIKDTL